jgi:hypothetical protein
MARTKTTAFLLMLLLAAGSRAWEIDLQMTRPLDGHSTSATGLFDLDADSVPELLVPGNRQLYCLDTSGLQRWQFEPVSQYFPSVSSPLAADVDSDGQPDVVVSTPLAVYRLSADGDSVWRRTLAGQGAVQNCIASTALGDINADSKLEVFCYEVYANRLLCLDPETGDTVWTFHPGKDARFSVGTPTIADLDQDGRLEVIGVVTDTSGGRTYCLSDSGRLLWDFETPGSGLSGWQLASVAVADVDGNDSLEVIGTANYWGIFCLDCAGDTLWTRRYAEHAATYPAIGDIDQDGALEVVSAFGPVMRCLDAGTGQQEWQFEVQSGYYIVSSPCLCDMDGDYLLETVFAEVKQNNPNDSLRPMWMLDCDGNPVWSDTVGTTMSDPVAADLDHDGCMEFCIGPTYRSSLFWRFEADTAAVVPGTAQWPTLQHDIWRTGWYEFQGPGTGLAGPGQTWAGRSPQLEVRPNPSSGQVRFFLPGPEDTELNVCDASGRTVARLVLERGVGAWDGTDLQGRNSGAGVYFAGFGSGARTRFVRLAQR